MHESLDSLCTSLENLSVAITNGWTGETTFNEAWGWTCPVLTRHDMASLPKELANRIRGLGLEEISDDMLPQINDLPRRLQILQSTTLPHLYSGNCSTASTTIISSIEGIEKVLYPFLEARGFDEIEQDKIEVTKSLARATKSLRAVEARVSEVAERSENLAAKVSDIQQAHEAAEQLPTDLAELKEKRETVAKLLIDSTADRGDINQKVSEINGVLEALILNEKRAIAILDRCDKAYRTTTSQGLASAFADRSSKLGFSMWIWVVGLIATLYLGASNGGSQLNSLAAAIAVSTTKNQNGSLWIELILTMLSIGAPIWFSWVATKQIGQRFRLAEDYAYKASISKAYEGYRREAELLDPLFQSRLFSSALNRLDEIPLRLVETDTHGSPWHELATSNLVRQALNTVPDFMEKVTTLAKQVLPQTSQTDTLKQSGLKTEISDSGK
jgi:hypothetical protein